MNIIVIANIISLLGAGVMVSTGLIRRKENVIKAQCLQFTLMGLSNYLLGGFTGVVTNILSFARNLICIKWEYTIPMKIIFIIIQAGIAYSVNTIGVFGWLPVISTSIFTWFLDIKSDLGMKLLIMGTIVFWIVYDFHLMNYVSTAFDIFTFLSNLFGAYMILRSEKNA